MNLKKQKSCLRLEKLVKKHNKKYNDNLVLNFSYFTKWEKELAEKKKEYVKAMEEVFKNIDLSQIKFVEYKGNKDE